MTGGPGGGWRACDGVTAVDVVVVLCLTTVLSSLAVLPAARALDVATARHAARSVAGALRSVRQRAIATRETTAVVFDQVAGRWGYRVCRDGNGNGVRRAELAAGPDTCLGDRVDLAMRFRGVRIERDPAIPGPDGDPPSPDPVGFGSHEIASCTPAGGCTPGSVFLRSPGGSQFATRVGGMTGRARLLRYEPGGRRWVLD